MKISFTLIFWVTIFCFGQEKKKIDHTVYDEWKSFSRITQSQTGEWITYEVSPSVGDSYLTIENTVSGQKKIISRGTASRIAYSEEFVVFKIAPQYDTIRKLKLEKVEEKDLPIDTLGVYYSFGDSLKLIPAIKSFKIANEGNWVGYMLNEDKTPDCGKARKCKIFKKKKSKCEKLETSGKTLVVWNPLTNNSKEFHGVVHFLFDKKGEKLAYVNSNKGEKDTLSLNMVDLKNWSVTKIDHKKLKLEHLSFNEEGTSLLYLGAADTNKRKNVELYTWSIGELKSRVLTDSSTSNMPQNSTVSEFRQPSFSEDGSKIFFGTNKIVRQEPKDTLLSSEKATVDVWAWDDPFIQPGQLIAKEREEKRSYLAVYHIKEQKLVQLADSLMKFVRLREQGNNNIAIGRITDGYEVALTWDFRARADIYTIDLKSGKRKLIKESMGGAYLLSPENDKFIWYNREDSIWVGKNLTTGEEKNLTNKIDAIFSVDNNGQPYIAQNLGTRGWIKINGKEYLIVRSYFDMWALNPIIPGDEICLTKGLGKSNKIRFDLRRFESDSTYVQLSESILTGIDDRTKNTSYWSLKNENEKIEIRKLMESNHARAYLSKAEKSDKVLVRRMNFQTYGELESTTMTFESIKVLTDINPQQKEYNWGTVEFTSWKAYDGQELKGLLYKPENFDPTKSYPLMVYFYSKHTNDIHVYKPPRATASIVYPAEYVSNGYIVFMPDIHYKVGHPAQSAFNCLVSGTDDLVRKYSWIDSSRMALQGQSWGGYQTAQLITMTNKYKAAMAGAPVSNMFSAYGGIRWGSGKSRMFQYEKTQSRIGATIWENPELYIENSPIFGIPNVTTPLLIMHNDGDGAVPWYQGIEMHMGLRRLSKPSWLLNYNGDAHNLRKLANKKDLSIRMRQFFDYYLLGAPMPHWMKYGVPAVDKGKNYGLELIND